MRTNFSFPAAGFLLISFFSVPQAVAAVGQVMTNQQLDQTQVGTLSSGKDIADLLQELLAVTNQAQTSTRFISNINAVNSVVSVQTNISLLLNSSGNITQANTTNITNK